MTTLQQTYELWTTVGPLATRVYGAALRAALAIKAESAATPKHAQRVALADRILGAPLKVDQELQGLIYARVLQTTAILDAGNEASDEQIQTAVNAAIDATV